MYIVYVAGGPVPVDLRAREQDGTYGIMSMAQLSCLSARSSRGAPRCDRGTTLESEALLCGYVLSVEP